MRPLKLKKAENVRVEHEYFAVNVGGYVMFGHYDFMLTPSEPRKKIKLAVLIYNLSIHPVKHFLLN